MSRVVGLLAYCGLHVEAWVFRDLGRAVLQPNWAGQLGRRLGLRPKDLERALKALKALGLVTSVRKGGVLVVATQPSTALLALVKEREALLGHDPGSAWGMWDNEDLGTWAPTPGVGSYQWGPPREVGSKPVRGSKVPVRPAAPGKKRSSWSFRFLVDGQYQEDPYYPAVARLVQVHAREFGVESRGCSAYAFSVGRWWLVEAGRTEEEVEAGIIAAAKDAYIARNFRTFEQLLGPPAQRFSALLGARDQRAYQSHDAAF